MKTASFTVLAPTNAAFDKPIKQVDGFDPLEDLIHNNCKGPF